MSFRDNIKTRADKAAQQAEVEDIEQSVSHLDVDDGETGEKSSKQQSPQIIESKKPGILCPGFFNVQVQELTSYINKSLMNAFNKTLDKRIDQRASPTDAKLNVITAQLAAITEAYATTNNQLQQTNNRLNELTNKGSPQRLLVDQGSKQEAPLKRDNRRLFDDEAQSESNSPIQSPRVDRHTFSSDSLLIAPSASFGLTGYLPKASPSKSLTAEQVSYFDSKKEPKSSNTVIKTSFFLDSMIIVRKHTYYKDVYVFVDRLKDQVKQHGHEQVKNVLYDCLRGDANY